MHLNGSDVMNDTELRRFQLELDSTQAWWQALRGTERGLVIDNRKTLMVFKDIDQFEVNRVAAAVPKLNLLPDL